MTETKHKNIQHVINKLFDDSKNDKQKIMKSIAKRIFRPMQPADFKDVYLSISKEQGEDLVQLIIDNNIKNIIEFGTSFGISTLFMAQGVIETNGSIITTELIESKAKKAIENFAEAEVDDYIDLRLGDAMNTLKNHNEAVDLLFLDGWKDLYLPLFTMLEPNFHKKTIIYVDNADMAEVTSFLSTVAKNPKYLLQPKYNGKAVLITFKA